MKGINIVIEIVLSLILIIVFGKDIKDLYRNNHIGKSKTKSKQKNFHMMQIPSTDPTFSPTDPPTFDPTHAPTADPTFPPTFEPTLDPTPSPSSDPTLPPTEFPTHDPTKFPTTDPTFDPTFEPTISLMPTRPTLAPTRKPTSDPTFTPTEVPTTLEERYPPTPDPTFDPTPDPSYLPTIPPTVDPTHEPTEVPTPYVPGTPTRSPRPKPTSRPTPYPSVTAKPTSQPEKLVSLPPLLFSSSMPSACMKSCPNEVTTANVYLGDLCPFYGTDLNSKGASCESSTDVAKYDCLPACFKDIKCAFPYCAYFSSAAAECSTYDYSYQNNQSSSNSTAMDELITTATFLGSSDYYSIQSSCVTAALNGVENPSLFAFLNFNLTIEFQNLSATDIAFDVKALEAIRTSVIEYVYGTTSAYVAITGIYDTVDDFSNQTTAFYSLADGWRNNIWFRPSVGKGKTESKSDHSTTLATAHGANEDSKPLHIRRFNGDSSTVINGEESNVALDHTDHRIDKPPADARQRQPDASIATEIETQQVEKSDTVEREENLSEESKQLHMRRFHAVNGDVIPSGRQLLEPADDDVLEVQQRQKESKNSNRVRDVDLPEKKESPQLDLDDVFEANLPHRKQPEDIHTLSIPYGWFIPISLNLKTKLSPDHGIRNDWIASDRMKTNNNNMHVTAVDKQLVNTTVTFDIRALTLTNSSFNETFHTIVSSFSTSVDNGDFESYMKNLLTQTSGFNVALYYATVIPNSVTVTTYDVSSIDYLIPTQSPTVPIDVFSKKSGNDGIQHRNYIIGN
jgi:hypothetical protein